MGGVVGCAIVCVAFVEEDGKIDISVRFHLLEFFCSGVFALSFIYMVLHSALFEFRSG